MLRRALVALCLVSGAARAQTDRNPRAEAFNERGKTLYYDRDYVGAAEKFEQAIHVTPDPRYYYNLCATFEKLDQLRQAADACDEVLRRGPRPELATKAENKAAAIRQRMVARPPPPFVPPAAPEAPAPAAPAEEVEAQPGLDYRFGLGADLGVVENLGVAGDHAAGLAVRLHGSALLSPRYAIGAEAYLHLSLFERRLDRPVAIVDLGAAAYWHRRLWRDLYVRPAAGVSVSAISIDDGAGGLFTRGALGLLLDGSLEWHFGGGMHVVEVTPLALSVYLPAGPGTRAGATWAFTVGYSMRFTGAFPGLRLE